MLEIIKTRLARARSGWVESQTRSKLFFRTHFLPKAGSGADGACGLKAAGAIRRLVRQQDGGAAVEFGLVAAPFLALVFAIMETAVIFFAGQELETAVADSSRLIMTGQAQTAAYTQAQFATYVCGQVPALFTCANIYIDVESYPAFSSVTINSQIDGANNFITNMQYSPGGPGESPEPYCLILRQ